MKEEKKKKPTEVCKRLTVSLIFFYSKVLSKESSIFTTDPSRNRIKWFRESNLIFCVPEECFMVTNTARRKTECTVRLHQCLQRA